MRRAMSKSEFRFLSNEKSCYVMMSLSHILYCQKYSYDNLVNIKLKTDLEKFSSSKMVIIFKIVHNGPVYFVQERLHTLVKMSGYSE